MIISLSAFIALMEPYLAEIANSRIESSAASPVVLPRNQNFFCHMCAVSFADLNEFRLHHQNTAHSSRSKPDEIVNEVVQYSHGKISLRIHNWIYTFWKCILNDAKETRTLSIIDTISKISALKDSLVLIILFRSGRFAGGIYDLNGTEIAEKTFRTYTVRGKQGGSQSSRDGSKQYNSAGAMIRAHNENKISHDIQTLLKGWNRHICRCTLFLWNFTPSGLRAVFDELGPMHKLKGRFNEIPFATGDPSLIELHRVKSEILTVDSMQGLNS